MLSFLSRLLLTQRCCGVYTRNKRYSTGVEREMIYTLRDFVVEVGGYWYKVRFNFTTYVMVGSLLQRAFRWLHSTPQINLLLDNATQAQSFEQWQEAALQIDQHLSNDLWRRQPVGPDYDTRLVIDRTDALTEAIEADDDEQVESLFRAGLLRNLGNITSPNLFHVAFAGTKISIDQYVRSMCLAVRHLSSLSVHADPRYGITAQEKMDLMHDSRQAYGRTALILQGGAIYGITHFGIIKALHLRGLLPRIIVGHGVGALVAALVCIHREQQLVPFLEAKTAILSHFSTDPIVRDTDPISRFFDAITDFLRKLERCHIRYGREGNLLGVDLLESLVKEYLGDMTFQEAYDHTKRVLNITVYTPEAPGSPTLLNYLTARDVLIRTAAMASNTASTDVRRPVVLLSKDDTGNIVPWRARNGRPLKSHRHSPTLSQHPRPLQRVAQLFNVNHFIVSQPRPYLAPLLRSFAPQQNSTTHRSTLSIFLMPFNKLAASILRLSAAEIHHRLAQLDTFGLLPSLPRRLLLDEQLPGSHIILSPSLTFEDLGKIFDSPITRDELDYWTLKGERVVWPNVAALKVRCAVEVELDRSYQAVRVSSVAPSNAVVQDEDVDKANISRLRSKTNDVKELEDLQ